MSRARVRFWTDVCWLCFVVIIAAFVTRTGQGQTAKLHHEDPHYPPMPWGATGATALSVNGIHLGMTHAEVGKVHTTVLERYRKNDFEIRRYKSYASHMLEIKYVNGQVALINGYTLEWNNLPCATYGESDPLLSLTMGTPSLDEYWVRSYDYKDCRVNLFIGMPSYCPGVFEAFEFTRPVVCLCTLGRPGVKWCP